MAGKKVLLIDADPQGSATLSLGYYNLDELPVTLSSIMTAIIEEVTFDPMEGILEHDEGIYLMPSNIALSDMDIKLADAYEREFVLQKYVNAIKDAFDYILIDCPPYLGLLTLDVLVASDSVLIPVTPEFLAARGLNALLTTVIAVKENMNPELDVEGILFTSVDSRVKRARTIMQDLIEMYSHICPIYEVTIPRASCVPDASESGESIFKYRKHSKPASAYQELVTEVLNNGRH